ncbi:hypothetical protein IMSAGC019_00977 [Lachnospiraceae bacterium]|nr:hypothetical protein IMSAGC019_00977 [Lachnospiraceae bacterium]
MEERKTVFDYMGRVLETFGFSVAILNIFCLIFGEEAEGFSTIFSLGKRGLSVATMGQFFSASVWVVAARFVFFTETVIKRMSLVLRTVLMVAAVLASTGIHILAFRWFPVDMWIPWLAFLVCFGICFAVSVVVTAFRERMENRKMEEALARLKEK